MIKRSNIFQKLKPAVMILLLAAPGYAQSASFTDTMTQPADGAVSPKKSAVSGYVKQDGIFKLAIDNPEGLRYRISVTDERGKVWYEEITSSGRFRRLLDLNYLSPTQLKVVITGSGEGTTYLVNRTEATYSAEKTVE